MHLQVTMKPSNSVLQRALQADLASCSSDTELPPLAQGGKAEIPPCVCR